MYSHISLIKIVFEKLLAIIVFLLFVLAGGIHRNTVNKCIMPNKGRSLLTMPCYILIHFFGISTVTSGDNVDSKKGIL